MVNAKLINHPLNFKFDAGTSRGVLRSKPTWYILLTDNDNASWGIGECSIIPGLSTESIEELPAKLSEVCAQINNGSIPSLDELDHWPAIRFALETALLDLQSNEICSPCPSLFQKGEQPIPINGLVWMGKADFMRQQIEEKISDGFKCIKMKIGAIDFSTEIELLKEIRKNFTPEQIEIRVDANGAFSADEALKKIEQLSQFNIHSIEQPIQPDQWKDMAVLCADSPIPIALDEELIGISEKAYQIQMLNFIQPQYIILKPSLLGGLSSTDQWISIANHNNIGWWATSALESNIGLNAIAQWVSLKDTMMPQGLGTGKLFTNNINSPLEIKNGQLFHDNSKTWDLSTFGK